MSNEHSKSKNYLFIIDPQNDFHVGGSLGVPGAHEDSSRIAKFIRSNISLIDGIYVSLDSHHRLHIAHSVFWKNASGEHPPHFTLIRSSDIEEGTWTPVDSSLFEYALSYAKALEEQGRFVICIWPEHCLIGTEGHAVVSVLNEALQEWSAYQMKTINYIHKGMNCLTEMYSAIKAEVPVINDPSTKLNRALLSDLSQANKLIFCGEAKSHCVNYTMRDVAAHWEKEMSSLYLLNNCTSAVPGFEEAANIFEKDMKDLGCQVVLHHEMNLRS